MEAVAFCPTLRLPIDWCRGLPTAVVHDSEKKEIHIQYADLGPIQTLKNVSRETYVALLAVLES
jgi:hypothetical protein